MTLQFSVLVWAKACCLASALVQGDPLPGHGMPLCSACLRKQPSPPADKLRQPLHALVSEWMAGQLADLPDDEKPPQQELDDDIVHMREEALARLMPTFQGCDALSRGEPEDEANASALRRLQASYAGLEAGTPIFTMAGLVQGGTAQSRAGLAFVPDPPDPPDRRDLAASVPPACRRMSPPGLIQHFPSALIVTRPQG